MSAQSIWAASLRRVCLSTCNGTKQVGQQVGRLKPELEKDRRKVAIETGVMERSAVNAVDDALATETRTRFGNKQ